MWILSSSSDRRALDVVDGTGNFLGIGPHYSRRTPGSKTFTGIGQEIVLIAQDGTAVWAVVRQRTPSARGSGIGKGRTGVKDERPKTVWRNMIFRNLGSTLSSKLILEAVRMTYSEWAKRYGNLPPEVMRTEIDPKKIRGTNPGFCYKMAGFHNARMVRGKLFLDAPCPTLLLIGSCSCCPSSILQAKP